MQRYTSKRVSGREFNEEELLLPEQERGEVLLSYYEKKEVLEERGARRSRHLGASPLLSS